MTLDIKTANELYEKAKSYWNDIYSNAEEDMLFSVGEGHWDANAKMSRGDRITLTINVLPQFIHQVVNDIRQNTPSIKVLPANDGNVDTADVMSGLIKAIEYKSNADTAYDTAVDCSVRGGIGFLRADHVYASDDGFEQEIRIKRVNDPLSVYIDPASIEIDGSDASFAFVLEKISVDEFERLYPDQNAVSFGSKTKEVKNESVIIAEVFVKETKNETKYLLEDGSVTTEKQKQYVSKRQTPKTTVRRYKVSGEAILEETVFPSKYIPIVPVYGEELWIDGNRKILSLIRQAKDSQRRYNFWASKEAELLSLAPVAPVMAEEGTVEDYANEWNNITNATVLRYKKTSLDGTPANIPTRLAPPPVPTGFQGAGLTAVDDIKKTLGMYNASLGLKSNAISGVAYNAQKTESDVATLHFGDNLNKAITQLGRIILDMIPKVYDTARILQIIGEEDEVKQVGINGAATEGQQIFHDLTSGNYDLRVTTGTSYTTKRQEAAQFMTQIVQSNPALMQVMGDLMFRNMDIAGSEELAERIKKTIPPQLLQSDNEGQDPEKMQMMQVIQQLQGQIQQLQQVDPAKQAELQLKDKDIEYKHQERMQELEIEAARFKVDYALKHAAHDASTDKMALDFIAKQSQPTAPTAEGVGQAAAS